MVLVYTATMDVINNMTTEEHAHELLDMLVAGQKNVRVRGGAAVAEERLDSSGKRTFRSVRSKGAVVAAAYKDCSFPSTGAHPSAAPFATQQGARLAHMLEQYCQAANRGDRKPPMYSPQAMCILSHIRSTYGFQSRVRIHAEVRVGSGRLDLATAADLVTPMLCKDGLVRLAFIEVKRTSATAEKLRAVYDKVVNRRKRVLGMPCSIRGRHSTEARLAVVAACDQHNIPLDYTVPVVLLITGDNKLSQVVMRWSPDATLDAAVGTLQLLSK